MWPPAVPFKPRNEDDVSELGIIIHLKDKTLTWNESEIQLKSRGNMNAIVIHTLHHMSVEAPLLQEAENRQKRILDADCSKVDAHECVSELDHLNTDEKDLPLRVLQGYPTSFGGGLGKLNVKPIHLEIKAGAKPHHAKAYPIPQAHEGTTKKEVNRLRTIDVLEKNSNSEWAAPTFIQKKKTGDVRALTDFRRLNAVLKRKPHPLPKMSDLLQKLTGFSYATAIDLSMGVLPYSP